MIEIDHDLDIDSIEGISIDKLIKDLQSIREKAKSQGLRQPKIAFNAGYESISVNVFGTKYVKPTAAQIKGEEVRVAKLKLRAQMKKEQRQLRREQEEKFKKWVEEHINE